MTDRRTPTDAWSWTACWREVLKETRLETLKAVMVVGLVKEENDLVVVMEATERLKPVERAHIV